MELLRILQAPKFRESVKYISREGNEQRVQFEIPEIIKRTTHFLTTCSQFASSNEKIEFIIAVYSQIMYFLISYKSSQKQRLTDALLNHFPEIKIQQTKISDRLFNKEIRLKGNPDYRNFHGENEVFLYKLFRHLPSFDFEVIFQIEKRKQEHAENLIAHLENSIKTVSERTSIQIGTRLPIILFKKHRGSTQLYKEADYAVKYFNTHLKRMEEGFTSGLWELTIKIRTNKDNESQLIADSISSLVAPLSEYLYPISKKQIDPLNRLDDEKNLPQFKNKSYALEQLKNEYKKKIGNICTNTEIASLISFPQNEIPGFRVKKHVIFGASIPEKTADLSIGNLTSGGPSNVKFSINSNDLVKHLFITGVTGIGKTVTAKHILSQISNKGIPFLVLEPAKMEYSQLANAFNDSNVRVFTAGLEKGNPIRINPLEFPPELGLQTHIDLLKSVFNASFPMYGPMPYILEKALNNIYRKMGWDLKSGRNLYLQDNMNSSDFYDFLPCLDDLYFEIEAVMKEISYSQELTSDVKAALRVRIGSLMTGAKGYMFNVKTAKPSINELLSFPTVLELQFLGDDEEKSFLMGLIFIRIYEHYLSKNEFASNRLNHITLIEEAHRLLRNISENSSMEIANVKGKALETFNNILSEMRAYGEGIMIADQIPTKLSPDTLKNSSNKIIHRLYAKDDREIVGDAIGLNEEQKDSLIHLEVGEAIVFHESLNYPVKVKITMDENIIAAKYDNPISESKVDIIDPYISIFAENDDLRKCVKKLFNTISLLQREQTIISSSKSFASKLKFELDSIIKGYSFRIDSSKLRIAFEEASKRIIKLYIQELAEKSNLLFNNILLLQKDANNVLHSLIINNLTINSESLKQMVKYAKEFSNIFSGRRKPLKACRDCKHSCIYQPLLPFLSKEYIYERDLFNFSELTYDNTTTEASLISHHSKMLKEKDLNLFADIIPNQIFDNLTYCIIANILQNDEKSMDRMLGIAEPFSASFPGQFQKGNLSAKPNPIKHIKSPRRKSSLIMGGAIAGAFLGGSIGMATGLLSSNPYGPALGPLVGLLTGIIAGASEGYFINKAIGKS